MILTLNLAMTSFIYFSLCLTVKLWELEFKCNCVLKILIWEYSSREQWVYNNSYCRYYKSFWNATIYVNTCTEMPFFLNKLLKIPFYLCPNSLIHCLMKLTIYKISKENGNRSPPEDTTTWLPFISNPKGGLLLVRLKM